MYLSETAIDAWTFVTFAPVLNPNTPERVVARGKYSSSTVDTGTTQVGDAQGSEVVVHFRVDTASTNGISDGAAI